MPNEFTARDWKRFEELTIPSDPVERVDLPETPFAQRVREVVAPNNDPKEQN